MRTMKKALGITVVCLILLLSIELAFPVKADIYTSPLPESEVLLYSNVEVGLREVELTWTLILQSNRNISFLGYWNTTLYFEGYLISRNEINEGIVPRFIERGNNLTITYYTYSGQKKVSYPNDAEIHLFQLEFTWIDNCSFCHSYDTSLKVATRHFNDTWVYHSVNATLVFRAWGPVEPPPYGLIGAGYGGDLEVDIVTTVIMLIVVIAAIVHQRIVRKRKGVRKRNES